MYKTILEQALPTKQRGYSTSFNLNNTNFLKLKLKFKKNLIADKKCILEQKNLPIVSNLKKSKIIVDAKIKELIFIKSIFFFLNINKRTKKVEFIHRIDRILSNKVLFVFRDLDECIFTSELLVNSAYDQIKLFGIRLLKLLKKTTNIYNILICEQIKMNHKNNKINLLTSEILKILNHSDNFYNLSPFLRCLLKCKNKWRIKQTICKTIQKIIKGSLCISAHEQEEFLYISERCLKDQNNQLQIDAMKIIIFLIESKNCFNFLYLPCLIKPVFDSFRRHNGKKCFIFLKAIRIFLSFYFSKLPIVLLLELIHTTLKLLKKGNNKLICLQIIRLCFKSKTLDNIYIRNKIIFTIDLLIGKLFPVLYNENSFFFIEELTLICKKFLKKKTIHSIINRFFYEKNKTNNSRIYFLKKLLIEYSKKKKISFNLIYKIFFLITDLLKKFSLSKPQNNYVIKLNLCHRTIESIVNNYPKFSSYFVAKLTGILKWELIHCKIVIRKQAAITIRLISNNTDILKKEYILHNIVIILFEKLSEKDSGVLSEIILSLNSILKILKLENFIFPPDNFLLELIPILKNRQKQISRNISKLFSNIIEKSCFFLNKNHWMDICAYFFSLSKNDDFLIKKYCLCSIYKIAKLIGPFKILKAAIDFYKKISKKHSFSQNALLCLFFERFGSQIAFPIFSQVFKITISNIELFEIKTIIYILWYLPKEKVKNYFSLICVILKKISEQKKRGQFCNFYILVGLFAQNSKNMGYTENLLLVLLNIWSDIYLVKRKIFKYIIFAIQSIVLSIDNLQFKIILSQGIFHPLGKIRKIYWYIYLNVKNKLYDPIGYLITMSINKRSKQF